MKNIFVNHLKKIVAALLTVIVIGAAFGQGLLFADLAVDTAEEASILNAVSEVPMPGSVPSTVSALDGEELLEAEDEAFLDETIDPAFIGTGPIWSDGYKDYHTNADKSFLTPDGKEFSSDYTYYDGWYYYDLGSAAGYGNLGDIYESCHPSGLYRSRAKLKPFTRLQSAFLVDTVPHRKGVTFDDGFLFYPYSMESKDHVGYVVYWYKISFPKDDDPSYVKKTLVYVKEFHSQQETLEGVADARNYEKVKSHFDDKYESDYPLLAGSRSVHVPGVPYNPLTEEEKAQQEAYLLELGRESREACEQNGGHDFEVVKKSYDDYVRFTYTCKNCGYEYMEREYLHTHTYTWQTIVAPTPTTRGYQRCMCTKCDSIKDGTGITYIYPTGVPKFDKSSVRLKVGESVDLEYRID